MTTLEVVVVGGLVYGPWGRSPSVGRRGRMELERWGGAPGIARD